MGDQRESFLSLSIRLTGFEHAELMASGMLEDYYRYLLKNIGRDDPPRLWALATKLDQLAKSGGDVAVNAEIQSVMVDQDLGPIAKNIIRLWYTGGWRKVADNVLSGVVASAQAYQEGLIWKVMHSHPPGAKQPGFGTWSELPR